MRSVIIILVGLFLAVCFQACHWPAVYIGNSSGILSYDRLQHRLDIMWESTNEIHAEAKDSVR